MAVALIFAAFKEQQPRSARPPSTRRRPRWRSRSVGAVMTSGGHQRRRGGGLVGVLGKLLTPVGGSFSGRSPDHPAVGAITLRSGEHGAQQRGDPLVSRRGRAQTLNRDKETASNAMVMRIVLNTTGVSSSGHIIGILAAADRSIPPRSSEPRSPRPQSHRSRSSCTKCSRVSIDGGSRRRLASSTRG